MTMTTDNRLVCKAAPGQVNKVSVKASSKDGVSIGYVIDDVVPVSIASGVPCTHPTASDLTKISCNATGQAHNSALLMLASGNDKAVDIGKADGNEVDGEDGNDSIVVGTDASVFGDAGNDHLYGGPGHDKFSG
ncbi:hypothetical protein [Streptomyces sp. NPDC050528]|uniref:hypothetical protein n=1 Tax=Streptomyces sp. NPDC050528 TaxID=3365623 RepID=UPI0037B937DF